jgi:hypothetical protein
MLNNPKAKTYMDKVPTNVRLETDVRDKVMEEVQKTGDKMNEVVNRRLKESYKE